jgi:hypothetical protein
VSAARVLDLADAAVAKVLEGWAAAGPDGAARAYAPPVNLTDDAKPVHRGRRLYVFPGPYSAEQMDRADQWRRFTVRALAVERYTDGPGLPPDAWMDERVRWFEQQVFNVLANQSLVLTGELTPDETEAATIDVLYDADVYRQHKTFWTVATFHFVESSDLTGAHP